MNSRCVVPTTTTTTIPMNTTNSTTLFHPYRGEIPNPSPPSRMMMMNLRGPPHHQQMYHPQQSLHRRRMTTMKSMNVLRNDQCLHNDWDLNNKKIDTSELNLELHQQQCYYPTHSSLIEKLQHHNHPNPLITCNISNSARQLSKFGNRQTKPFFYLTKHDQTMDKKRPDTNSEHCYPILQTDHLANFNQTSLAFPNIHIEYDTGMDHTDRNIEQSIPQKGLGFHCDRESNIQNNYPVLPTSLEQLKQLRCNLNEGNCVNKEKMTTTREQQKPLDAASNLCSIEHLRSKVEEKETTTPTAATCHSAEIMVKSRSISARTSTIPPEMMSHIPPISNTSTTKPSSSQLTCSPSRPVGSSNNNLRQQRTFSSASCASSSLSSSTNTVSSSSSSQYTSSPTSNMFTMFIAPPPQVVNTTTTTTTSTTNNHPLLMRSGTSPTNCSPSVMRMTTSRLSTRNNCKFFEYKPGNGNKLQKTPATLESPQTMGVTMNKIEKQKKMKIMMSVPQTQTATTNVNLIQQHVVPHHSSSSTSGCKMDALLSGSRSSVNNILNNTSFQLPSMTTEETLLSSPTTTSVSSNNMITTQLPPISTLATPKTFRTAISIHDILN